MKRDSIWFKINQPRYGSYQRIGRTCRSAHKTTTDVICGTRENKRVTGQLKTIKRSYLQETKISGIDVSIAVL